MADNRASPSAYACAEGYMYIHMAVCQSDPMAATGDINCEGSYQKLDKLVMPHKSAAHPHRGVLHPSKLLLPDLAEIDELHSKVLLIVLFVIERSSSPGSLHRARDLPIREDWHVTVAAGAEHAYRMLGYSTKPSLTNAALHACCCMAGP